MPATAMSSGSPMSSAALSGQRTEMTVGGWLLTFLIQLIPLVGFVMLCVWGFGKNSRPARRTYAQAVLLLFAAVAAVYVLVFVVIGVSFMSVFGG